MRQRAAAGANFYMATDGVATPLGRIQYNLWETPKDLLLVDRTYC